MFRYERTTAQSQEPRMRPDRRISRGPAAQADHARRPAFPGRPAARPLGRTTPAETARLVPGLRGRLPGRQAERFGRDLVVVPGQDLAEAARPVRDGAAADPAARDRKMGNGHGQTAGTGLADGLHDASPARLTLRPPRTCRSADSAALDGAGPGLAGLLRGAGCPSLYRRGRPLVTSPSLRTAVAPASSSADRVTFLLALPTAIEDLHPKAAMHKSACRTKGARAYSTPISGALVQNSPRSCGAGALAGVCATG